MDPNDLFAVRLPEPDPADPKPLDPPCAACDHRMSAHEEDGCDECGEWGGPCA